MGLIYKGESRCGEERKDLGLRLWGNDKILTYVTMPLRVCNSAHALHYIPATISMYPCMIMAAYGVDYEGQQEGRVRTEATVIESNGGSRKSRDASCCYPIRCEKSSTSHPDSSAIISLALLPIKRAPTAQRSNWH